MRVDRIIIVPVLVLEVYCLVLFILIIFLGAKINQITRPSATYLLRDCEYVMLA